MPLSLVVLAAVLVLWAGPALGQTITISPTTAQTLPEGQALKVTLTVNGLAAGQVASIDFKDTGRTASVDDFEVYQQATEPSGSDTPVTLAVLNSGYAYYDFATDSDPVGPVTFWVLAKTDTVLLDPDLTLLVEGLIYVATPFKRIADTSVVTVTLTDATPILPPTGKPTTPANLTAVAGKGVVTLTWDAIDATSGNSNLVNDLQITKHQVRQSTDGGANYGTWTDIPNSGYGEVNAANYTIGSLTDDTEYTFQVRAVNAYTGTGGGNSDPATAIMVTPDADGLAQPTGLMATAGNTEITLTWTDPGDATVQFYQYQQKVGSAAFGPWTGIPDSTATTTSYRYTGLDNGTTYSYRIRARRGVETGPASDAVTATPRGVPPAAPVLTATPRNGGVTLSWPNPRDASLLRWEYQYKIGTGIYQPWQTAREQSEESCGSRTSGFCGPPYLNTSGATLQFPVGGLTNGTPHAFRIRAVNADGTATSNEASATPVAGVPAKPTGLTTRWVESRTLGGRDYRVLEWDGVADPSILRYEFTADEGRTWSLLTSDGSADRRELPDGEFRSGYTFRIRAVNAAGPGPASDEADEEEEDGVTRAYIQRASLEWDAITRKATLVWDHTALGPRRGPPGDLLWWQLDFDSRLHRGLGSALLPIGTTRYEIPGTFRAGDRIEVRIAGCVRSAGCIIAIDTQGQSRAPELHFKAGGSNAVVTGFSATPGDAQVTLAWDAPTDSGITHFEYEVSVGARTSSDHNDIPDGDDADTNAGNETSHTVTAIYNAYGAEDGTAPVNGQSYNFRLRAANAIGGGPWTEWVRYVIPLAAGVPAKPSGVVALRSGGFGLTTWDDPQDPSITAYQRPTDDGWVDVPGTDATTTGINRWTSAIRAVNANGWGPSAGARITRSPAPARPTGLQAAPGKRLVTLTWDDPGRDVYIEFYRYTADGGDTWTEIPNSQSTVQGQFTRYTVPNLTNGQAHTFAIQAENDTGTSPVSEAVTATPRGGAPARPTGLSAAPGNAEATLTWDDPHDASITRYQVKQDAAAWADISGSGAGTTSHTVGTLTNGTAYTFRIRAVNNHSGDNAVDPGLASDAVTVTPGVPAAPASLTVAPGNEQATLTWTAPASNNGSAVTGYEYTSNAAAPVWTDVPDSGSDGRADETQYTVTSLVNNNAYAFAVRAENANGPGAATRAVRAVPVHPDAPQRPAALKANPGHELVRLTWRLPSFQHPVTSYQYRQSTDGGTTWNPDWTAITGSGAATTEHLLTGLANGTTYTFELRALNGGTEGPSTRAQATPSRAAAEQMITPGSSGQLTTPTGSTYTVTQLSPPGLDWRIAVPGTTEIDGRTFTLRPLQGTTPETSQGYAFTSTGQEGLDIVVQPPLAGQVQVCLEPTPLLRREAGGGPLLVLRYDGTGWTPLPATTDGGMVCGTTSGFSAFALGYEAAGGGEPPPVTPPGTTNAAPEAAQPLPPRTVAAGETSEPLDLTPYFQDPDGDPLTFAAASDDARVAIANLPRGSSRLTLHGVAAGEAVVVVTARDPGGAEVSQRMRVTVVQATVVRTNAGPEAAQPLPPRTVLAGTASEPLDLTPYFRDPDGDPLTYAAVSDNAGVAIADLPRGSNWLILRGVAAGEAVVVVTARDPDGAEASQPMRVTVRTNAGPEVAQPLPPRTMLAGETSEPLDLTPYFRDPDGDPVTYTAVSYDAGVLVAELSEGGNELTLRAVAAGEAVVVVTARDPDGAEASQPMRVTVRTNAAPEAAQPLPPRTMLADTTSEPLDLTPYFDDPDGDPLTYAAVSDNAGVAIADLPRGSNWLILRGVAAGEAVVVVTVSDPDGEHASQPMRVTVRTNAGPELVQPLPPRTMLAGETSEPLDLTPYFRDPDGDPLTYTAVSNDAGVLVAEVAEGGNELTLRAVAAGEAVVMVTASDADGEHASQPMRVTVRTNAAPEAAQPLPPQTVLADTTSEPLDLTPYFRDPDGDPLTYAAVSDNAGVAVAEVAEGGNQLTLRGVAPSEVVVVVTARDPWDAAASQPMRVTVRTNAAPEAAQPLPPQTVLADTTSEPLDLTPYFDDPDGDPLTYAAVSDDAGVLVAEVAEGGNQLTLRGVGVGEAVVVVTARDPWDAAASQPMRVTVRTNAAPEAAQPLPPQTVLADTTSEPLDLTPYFDDPDGDPLTYAAVSDNAGVAVAEVAEGGNQLTLRGVAPGEAVVVVTARDPWDAEASQPMTLTVRTNAAPEAAQPLPAQTVLAGETSEPLDLTPYFDDPDGDPLTYAAVSDDAGVAVAELSEGGNELTLRAVGAGEAVVVVTARDPWDAEASQPMTLTVRTNAAPEAAQPLPAQTVLVGAASEPLDLTPYFHDPDGDPLTYAAVSTNAEVATVGVVDDLFTLTGVAAGTVAVTVTARDPHGGEASQAVVVTVTAVHADWVKAWAARFGRTVSGHVLDGVQERLRAAPRPGFQATLAGHQLGGMGEGSSRESGDWQLGGPAALQRQLEALTGRTDEQMSNGAPQQGSTARDLFTSSAFSLTVGDADEGGGGFGALWGRGAVSRFDGRDGPLSLTGEVATGMVGMDWVSRRWRSGLALAMSRGIGGYSAAVNSGDIESKLTGLFPWVGYDVTDRVSVWATAGYGAGVLTLTPENAAATTAELALSMVAAGARSELLELSQLGGVMLALETDTRLTRTTTGAIAGLEATEASVWQRRLGLEGSRAVALAGRLSLRPSVEVGLRYDGGDAETGAGMDVGAGLGFSDSGTGWRWTCRCGRCLCMRPRGSPSVAWRSL